MLSLLSRRAVASRQPALAVRAFRTAPIARELNEGDQGTGKCKWFDASRGFGFIEAGEEDLFVHFSGIEGKGFRSLAEGEPVEFTVTRGDRGKLQAVQVTGPEGARVQGAPRRESSYEERRPRFDRDRFDRDDRFDDRF